MAYVVLARKYRPRRFEDMVGQDTAVRALGNALKQQRLHHAYLFTGTRGIGKTTVSRIFAKCLNCLGTDGLGGITATPCGVCAACTQIDDDRFIDYIELDAASNRGIAEIRDLLDRAAYKPSVGRFKVFMIDEAHQLTKESFNALLKTLEEPPDYVKFVLATTDPQKMPATVLSRCLQFNLRPMAPQTVRDHLSTVLLAEGIVHEDAALNVLGRAAQGSMRDALSLTDQAIAFGGGELKADAVRAMLGSVGREPAVALIAALAARDGKSVVTLCSDLRMQGLSPDGTLESMAAVLQDMAIEQAVSGSVDDGLPDGADVKRLAAVMPADDTQLLYSIVLHGRRELNLAPDAHAGLTMVLLRMLAFGPANEGNPPARAASPRALAVPSRSTTAASGGDPPAPSAPRLSTNREPVVDAGPQRFDREPTGDHAANRPPLAAVTAAMPALVAAGDATLTRARSAVVAATLNVADVERTPLGDRWETLVAQLQGRQLVSAMVRELAMQSSLLAVDDEAVPPRWQLQVEREALRAATVQDKLVAAMTQLLGLPQALTVVSGVALDTPAAREAQAQAKRARDAERIVHEDPLVQAMLAQFKTARIVPGSIKSTQEHKP